MRLAGLCPAQKCLGRPAVSSEGPAYGGTRISGSRECEVGLTFHQTGIRSIRSGEVGELHKVQVCLFDTESVKSAHTYAQKPRRQVPRGCLNSRSPKEGPEASIYVEGTQNAGHN